ncbi:MAG: PilZ domain-containing protein [Endomicrobiia bacterium]
MPNRRKYIRIPVTILVDLYPSDSLAKKGRGCIVDLSLGGMAIETEAELELNSEIFMRINLPTDGGQTIFDVFANVIRKQDMGNIFHYGVKYTRINFFEKLKLRSFIKRWIKKHKER